MNELFRDLGGVLSFIPLILGLGFAANYCSGKSVIPVDFQEKAPACVCACETDGDQ